ncbi:MAG TPA: TOPRIM nucleotidyl transferase/hydrolase domain-containing protein, partial [Candidatus Saccharimonadales bacterium]
QSTPSSTASTVANKWPNLLGGDFLEATETEWKKWSEELIKIDDAPSTGNNSASYSIKGNLSHDAKGEWFDDVNKNNLNVALNDRNPINLLDLHTRFGRAFKSQQSYQGTVENRLWLSQNASGPINATKYSSQLKAAPFLATNKDVLSTLNRLMRRLFNKQFFAESNNYPSYTLDIAPMNVKPPKRASSSTDGLLKNKKYYIDWKRDNNVQDISQEGHGVRATSELLYAFENKSKKINFIDEPELHLYPATKYSLGKIISNYSTQAKQTILVTHDTEMLRGLVYGSKNATVLRINSRHELSYISANTIGRAYSSDILQGAFQDGVVIVEGITDKYVYSNAFNEKHLSDDYSLQVVSMYGKGSLAVPIPFYESMKIKNAVIADFDIIFPEKTKSGVRKHVLEILGKRRITGSKIQEIETSLDSIWHFMQGRVHKNKGLNCPDLTSDEKTKISNLINPVKQYGLFIVPYGGLEDWVKKDHGTSPEAILAIYRSRSNSVYKPLTDFLTEVSSYLKP